VVVKSVAKDSRGGARRSQSGDMIVAVNGTPVTLVEDIRHRTSARQNTLSCGTALGCCGSSDKTGRIQIMACI
jgi:hypothetical protein